MRAETDGWMDGWMDRWIYHTKGNSPLNWIALLNIVAKFVGSKNKEWFYINNEIEKKRREGIDWELSN